MIALSRCPCGRYPWEAPYGELCPESDPDDPGFHDFAPGPCEGERVTLPARSPSDRPGPRPFGSDRPGRSLS